METQSVMKSIMPRSYDSLGQGIPLEVRSEHTEKCLADGDDVGFTFCHRGVSKWNVDERKMNVGGKEEVLPHLSQLTDSPM